MSENLNMQHSIAKLLDGVAVEWKPLGEVSEIVRGKTITAKSSIIGNIPVISGGKNPAYYINTYNRDGETITIAGSGAYAGFVMYWDKPIFVSDSFSIKPYELRLSTKYTYHFLSLNQQKIYAMKKGSGVPHVYPKDVSNLLIPIPPLYVQSEIVRILDTFTEITAELTAELTARKKQYDYFRDKLLTFKEEEVEWQTLGEIAKIRNGKDWKKLGSGDIPVYGTGGIMGYVNTFAYNKPTVLIPRKGTITNIFYLESPFWNVDTIYYTEIDELKIIPKFFYYYMKMIDLTKFDTGSGRPSLTKAILDNINIPIPTLKEQARIVEILDKFDAITNSLSEGLPREIELRQKQYEYYRNLLLNFPKVEDK